MKNYIVCLGKIKLNSCRFKFCKSMLSFKP